MFGWNGFFKELLIGCAISGVIGIGCGIAACSCVDKVMDRAMNALDQGTDANAVVEDGSDATDGGADQGAESAD